MRDALPLETRDLHAAVRDAVVVVIVALVAYLPVLWTGFTSDDFFILGLVKQLGGIRHPLAYFSALGFFEYYRPLTFLSHALDWSIWGLNPVGFHFTSLVLHAANATLVAILGRRLAGRTAGVVAGLLFALHAASHEAVYWMAARFDLLATLLTLAAIVLICGARRGYWAGVLAFAGAILAKESAIAVPVVIVAYDAIVARLEWRQTVRRLLPFVIVAAAYAVLRSQAGALEATGGASRLPKLLMLGTIAGGGLWLGHALRTSVTSIDARFDRRWTIGLTIGAAIVAGLMTVPGASDWLRPKIGFASFSVFYLVSPIALPGPPASWFDRPTTLVAIIELVALVVVAVFGWRRRRWLAAHPLALFLIVFIAATLAPVSSMTSGTRYLYLASAAVSLLAGVVVQALSGPSRARLLVAIVIALGLSVVELGVAARSWKWAGEMTTNTVALMAPTLPPCGTQDVVLLTTPVGIRGVYSNFNEAALEVVAGCAPGSFATVLRVERVDAHVDVTRRGDTIELRVPEYAGNFVASRDLSVFDLPIVGQEPIVVDTPIGRLESTEENGTRVFTLALDSSKARARFFFYSDGQFQALRSSAADGNPSAVDAHAAANRSEWIRLAVAIRVGRHPAAVHARAAAN